MFIALEVGMAQTLANRETPDYETRANEAPADDPSMWVVELNIAGCRIRRRAAKRRNLLWVPALRPSGAA